MDQFEIKTLKMSYKNELKNLTLPSTADYEECLEIAIDIFNIPTTFKKYVKIFHECGKTFEKQTFDYYNLLFPSPESIFSIKIDKDVLLNKEELSEILPTTNLKAKRKLFQKCETDAIDAIQKSWDEIVGCMTEGPASKKLNFLDSEAEENWWHILID